MSDVDNISFNSNGQLIPGIYTLCWLEFFSLYSYNPKRKRLLRGLYYGIIELKKAGATEIFVDGSFVTQKVEPNDFDACWNLQGVDLKLLDPIFLDFRDGRKAQKARFGGEFFPHNWSAIAGTGLTFLEFFQKDKFTGDPKGIIRIDLRTFT